MADQAMTVIAWRVVVNDPDQSRPHRYRIEAEDPDEARRIAARRAIISDPRGAGVFVPALDIVERRNLAQDDALVEAVAAYAVAVPDGEKIDFGV